MFLAYMDECGNTGTYADPDQPIHFLGCLVVEDVAVRPLEEAVRSVAKQYFPDHWLDPRFEFHGVDLFGGKGFFKGTSVQHRIDAAEALMAVASEHAAGFAYSGVNKLKSFAKEHPHRICFTFLAERLQGWLASRDGLALLVSDENHEVEQDIIRDIQTFKRSTTQWGYKRVAITRVIDSYQCALRLTYTGDSQTDENLIRRCKHMEACDGGSDWGSIRLHIVGFAWICATK